MYRISKNGVVLGYTERIYYVRKNPTTGLIVQCREQDATGVAYNGTVYNLIGLPRTMGDDATESIFAQPIDTGNELNRIQPLEEAHIAAEQAITDLDIANIEAQQQITELELEILGG